MTISYLRTVSPATWWAHRSCGIDLLLTVDSELENSTRLALNGPLYLIFFPFMFNGEGGEGGVVVVAGGDERRERPGKSGMMGWDGMLVIYSLLCRFWPTPQTGHCSTNVRLRLPASSFNGESGERKYFDLKS